MIAISEQDNLKVLRHTNREEFARQMAEDVRTSLSATPRYLPSKYFYDERGSNLFDEITRLPEYYLTRTETAIIREHGVRIIASMNPWELLELGSGTATKTRLLLNALSDRPEADSGRRRFVAFDISEETLRRSVQVLGKDYPTLTIAGMVGDFSKDFALLPRIEFPRAIAFLGSTIGNLNLSERREFFAHTASALKPDDFFLLGVDLVKAEHRLVAAYDDSAGVTAEFNRNILRVLNRQLDADFPVAEFQHVARWNAEYSRIESWLIPNQSLEVKIGVLDQTLHFAAGQGIHTEISAKFTRSMLEEEFAPAGLRIAHWFTDPDEQYALVVAQIAE